MKTNIVCGSVVLWTTLLIAMENSHEQIHNLELKLTTNQFARGRVMDVPLEQEKSQCIFENFQFTLVQNNDSDYPLVDLLISTADDHQTPISSIRCPLIPHTTSSVSFTHNNLPYTVSLAPIQLKP